MLDPECIDVFQRDAALCLRGLLTPQEIDLLRAGVDHNLELPAGAPMNHPLFPVVWQAAT